MISSRDALLQYWAIEGLGIEDIKKVEGLGIKDAKKGKTEEKGFLASTMYECSAKKCDGKMRL